MTLTVSAADANRRFSEILGSAQRGDTVVITKRGRPVARLAPYRDEGVDQSRDAAFSRLLETMRDGFDLGGERFDRDALYDR